MLYFLRANPFLRTFFFLLVILTSTCGFLHRIRVRTLLNEKSDFQPILDIRGKFPLFAKGKSWKVTIQHEGKDSVLDINENVSILEAALDAGIELPHDCKLGVCLTCPSRLISGQLDQGATSLDVSVQEKGYALTCMSYPRSDCVISSIEEDELIAAQFEGRS